MSTLGLASGTILQMAYTVPDIEAAVAGYVRRTRVGPWSVYQADGYEPVYTTRTPVGSRVAYFDTTDHLPGMVELLALTPAQDARPAGTAAIRCAAHDRRQGSRVSGPFSSMKVVAWR